MAIPQYNQNKAGDKLDALIDNKYNYKLYGIPLAICGDAEQILLAGADDTRFIHKHDSGLTVYGNYVGANTIDVPPGHVSGVDYSITKTDNIGCQWTTGPYLAGGLEGKDIFTVGSSALPKPTDFASLNMDIGNVLYETNNDAGGATSADSGANVGDDGAADGGFHWYEVRVSKVGLVSFYLDGVQLTTNDPAFSFDVGDIVTPWFYFREHTTLTDLVIDEVEFGLQ